MRGYKITRNSGYQRFDGSDRVNQFFADVVGNLEETLADLRIPEGFATEEALLQAVRGFKALMEEYGREFGTLQKKIAKAGRGPGGDRDLPDSGFIPEPLLHAEATRHEMHAALRQTLRLAAGKASPSQAPRDSEAGKKPKWLEWLSWTAEALKALATITGVLTGVVSLALWLLPDFRAQALNLVLPKYDVYLGYLYGPQLERLMGDQFQSTAWAHGLGNIENIFAVEDDTLRNASEESPAAHSLKSGKSLLYVAPGACIHVESLRFEAIRAGQRVANITSDSLRAQNEAHPGSALLARLPKDFTSPDCTTAEATKTHACGHVNVMARAMLVDCGPHAKSKAKDAE
jgi:hypothetical protein